MSTELLEGAIGIARRAAKTVLEVYATDFGARRKTDASPVTEADERAAALIVAGLSELTPGVPVVCEETAGPDADVRVPATFWLVDPLDGTKEFISRNGEFTVNIALVESRRPLLGVVFAPAVGRLFAGLAAGAALIEEGSTRRSIRCRPAPADGLTAVTSRSHENGPLPSSLLRGRTVVRSTSAGSSLKFCLVAAGAADVYPRLGRTMEWDTAAGQAVLMAAGGRVTNLDGIELTYGKPGLENPHFVAWGFDPGLSCDASA